MQIQGFIKVKDDKLLDGLWSSMKPIDIAQILSPDLRSWMRAQDLRLYIQNTGEKTVTLDFNNVKFATRSFMDELYNLFFKDSQENAFSVTIVNVPENIKAMPDAVSRTQVKTTIPSELQEVSFPSVN